MPKAASLAALPTAPHHSRPSRTTTPVAPPAAMHDNFMKTPPPSRQLGPLVSVGCVVGDSKEWVESDQSTLPMPHTDRRARRHPDFFPPEKLVGGYGGGSSLYSSRPDSSPDGLRYIRGEGMDGMKLKQLAPISTRRQAPASQVGMPYMEQQHLLQKRNRVLEAAVKRMGAELAELRDGEEARQRAHAVELNRLQVKLEKQEARYEERLEAAAAERAEALDQQKLELTGEAAQSERARREREKQIEHLTQMAARRMGRRELARGWGGWLDVYLERVHKRNLLRQAAARLTKPKLAASYASWRQGWAAAMAAARVAAARAEEQRAAAARAQASDAERDRRAAEEAAQAKEQRVAHLTQLAVRRLGKQGLGRGFGAWAEAYTEAVRRRRLLQAAGARLLRPKLVASYREWRDAWRAAEVGTERSRSNPRSHSHTVTFAHTPLEWSGSKPWQLSPALASPLPPSPRFLISSLSLPSLLPRCTCSTTGLARIAHLTVRT